MEAAARRSRSSSLRLYIVDHRNGIFQFFENGVLHHLGSDHVLELKLVEREDADHLHQSRREDLPLRDLQIQSWLKEHHKFVVGLWSLVAINPSR